jgi:hypothetical protein
MTHSRRRLLEFFARWLPPPFVPSDLRAAGETLAEATESVGDAATVAARHRCEARSALARADRDVAAAALAIRRLGREVALREAQLDPPPRSGSSSGDA